MVTQSQPAFLGIYSARAEGKQGQSPSLKVKMPFDSFGCRRTVGSGLAGEAVGPCQMLSFLLPPIETPATWATGAALLSLPIHGTKGKNCVVHKSHGYQMGHLGTK